MTGATTWPSRHCPSTWHSRWGLPAHEKAPSRSCWASSARLRGPPRRPRLCAGRAGPCRPVPDGRPARQLRMRRVARHDHAPPPSLPSRRRRVVQGRHSCRQLPPKAGGGKAADQRMGRGVDEQSHPLHPRPRRAVPPHRPGTRQRHLLQGQVEEAIRQGAHQGRQVPPPRRHIRLRALHARPRQPQNRVP